MSTRGLYGFKKDGDLKVTYNHFDSYPDGLGRDVLKFVEHHNMQELIDFCDRIILVENGAPIDDEQARWCESYMPSIGRSFDEKLRKNNPDNWYDILHELMGDLDKTFKVAKEYGTVYMIDDACELHFRSPDYGERTWCEYAYIIDLDDWCVRYYPDPNNADFCITYSFGMIRQGYVKRTVRDMNKWAKFINM